ncbi:hypothetical protein [Deinococcus sp.]|uniref:hypothetical protein n=1 Tax=Deinococcus sp. TaxID=47478 RepID=UPI0025C52836|nr:hypothetical protein [Deinococcus sp.]
MARSARYARYQFAPWPDPALLEAVQSFEGEGLVTQRLEQSRDGLTIDLSDNRYDPPDDTARVTGRHSRLLRLEWPFENSVFALESYDEFYAGPWNTFHPSRQGVQSPGLYEVVNEPDPWIAEILAENNNTDTFPPYGSNPVMLSGRTRQMNPHLRETGRFFPADAPLAASGTATDYHFWTGLQPPAPGELEKALAEARAKTEARWEARKQKPRYRHLFIASETCLLEILCEDLPRWTWVAD